ncbi:MAG TPA: NAD(P)H-hydrate dehydratase [Puia sp.]|jgi:NAD(P)H-hydrate epimerase|nr:NAD(P)H-hydrate dehydratase [Puia sp.]
MEILSAGQIRAWDEYTMQHEPIASIDLMERAAASCHRWLESNGYAGRSFAIYCGKGNNGGDGLALARMLSEAGYSVTVHILEFGFKGTDDFQINLARLHQTPVEVRFVQGPENFHPVNPGDILVDALLGSGLNRKLEGVAAGLVDHLNASGNEIVAIDIPSGLFVEKSSRGNTAIRATHTLSFQCYKPAFLMPENAVNAGVVHILDIGLHPGYLQQVTGVAELLDAGFIRSIYRPRPPFAHKGNFGHALLIAGSFGKMGAAVLGARACLRAGAGLLSCHIPGCGYPILQTAVPEAMVFVDVDEQIHTAFEGDPSTYSVVGVGPGIGTEGSTVEFLRDLLQRCRRPMVLDADALNILASSTGLWELVPPYSILTPHPKEFERLFGPSSDDYEQLDKAREQARERQCIIVLKGHYSFIAMPGGKGYFNSTGNPGMAKGGSGDVLTGILTALLSQGYSPGEAALLGVYLHGLAGDLAASAWSQESMLASDLTDRLGQAFQQVAIERQKAG